MMSWAIRTAQNQYYQGDPYRKLAVGTSFMVTDEELAAIDKAGHYKGVKEFGIVDDEPKVKNDPEE